MLRAHVRPVAVDELGLALAIVHGAIDAEARGRPLVVHLEPVEDRIDVEHLFAREATEPGVVEAVLSRPDREVEVHVHLGLGVDQLAHEAVVLTNPSGVSSSGLKSVRSLYLGIARDHASMSMPPPRLPGGTATADGHQRPGCGGGLVAAAAAAAATAGPPPSPFFAIQ